MEEKAEVNKKDAEQVIVVKKEEEKKEDDEDFEDVESDEGVKKDDCSAVSSDCYTNERRDSMIEVNFECFEMPWQNQHACHGNAPVFEPTNRH